MTARERFWPKHGWAPVFLRLQDISGKQRRVSLSLPGPWTSEGVTSARKAAQGLERDQGIVTTLPQEVLEEITS